MARELIVGFASHLHQQENSISCKLSQRGHGDAGHFCRMHLAGSSYCTAVRSSGGALEDPRRPPPPRGLRSPSSPDSSFPGQLPKGHAQHCIALAEMARLLLRGQAEQQQALAGMARPPLPCCSKVGGMTCNGPAVPGIFWKPVSRTICILSTSRTSLKG